MPQLVSKEKLPGLNSASHIINASSSILAPVLGGIVFALIDIRIFILANGISFLISAISESFIDFKFNSTQKVVSPETVTMKSVGKSLKEGFVYLRNNGSLMKLLWIFIVFNISFSFGVMVPIPYILNNYYMVGATAYGIVNGFAPAGVVLGAAIIGFFMKKISFKSLLFVLTIAMSILMLMISLPLLLPLLESSNLIIVIFFAFLRFSFGLLMSMVDVPIITYIQSETEEQYRGRVFSIILALVKVSTPVALMISGFLTDYMNPMILPLIAGVFALISFLFLQRDAVKAIFSREKCFEAE
jgi:MFS family permease